MRDKKVGYNIITNIVTQILVGISGFIIPKLILIRFGSTTNGMINSITQFLSYAALVEMGIGNAAVAALYKTIADKQLGTINTILKQAKNKYCVSGVVYTVIAVIISLLYPRLVGTQVNYQVATIIAFILAVNGLIDYFIIGKYKVLLIAEQETYILNIFKGLATIILTVTCAFGLAWGFSLYVVKVLAVLTHLFEAVLIKQCHLDKHFVC